MMAGNIYMRFPGGKHKVLTLSYDDGVGADIRLIGIMQQHGLKGTFNVNSGIYPTERTLDTKRMPLHEAKEVYLNSGMEIGVHALTHPILSYLPDNICTYEILQDRINHERDYDCIIRGMAYPQGTVSVSDSVVATLKQCGIAYARTTVSTERFDLPVDWLRLPATCRHSNPRLMELAEQFVREPFNRAPGMFYLWGHSYEFVWDKPDNNWGIIERFAAYIGGREEIWYATNIEIYDYIAAYKQLIFSVDGTKVHNPTATTLYFEANNALYHVQPGETLRLS